MINPRLGNPYYIVIYYMSHDITNSNSPMKKKVKKVNKLKKATTAKAKRALKAKKK